MLSFRPKVSTIDITEWRIKKIGDPNTELENLYCKGKGRKKFETLGGRREVLYQNIHLMF